jgi:R3H-associated N-terminal domain
LLSNPWAVTPLPTDYEVRPTYPIRSVPYYLAPLWDAAEFQRSVEAKLQGRQSKKGQNKYNSNKHGRTSPAEEAASNVPKEVRAKLKRARAAKGILQDLEEQVRLFLQKWNERQALRQKDGLGDAPALRTPRQSFHMVNKPRREAVPDSALISDSDSSNEASDEEIVFVGRNGTTLDSPGRKARERKILGPEAETLGPNKLVYEGLEADKWAGFARWLVHSIGTYYGLKTWSVTTEGQPAMREAYVGVEGVGWGRYAGRCQMLGEVGVELPRPLWAMV